MTPLGPKKCSFYASEWGSKEKKEDGAERALEIVQLFLCLFLCVRFFVRHFLVAITFLIFSSENLLDCISWPSALVQNDSAYINDPFQLTLSEDHEEDSPKSSSFDSRIHNSDFSLLDLPSLTSLESKSINETLFGKLQPWSPPANYEVSCLSFEFVYLDYSP